MPEKKIFQNSFYGIAFIIVYLFLVQTESVAQKLPINDWSVNKNQSLIEKYSLDKLVQYAISNNPLYLAEKKNIEIARGEVITAALYNNPVLYFEQQFMDSKTGYSGLGYLVNQGDSGGGVETAPKISYDFDISNIRSQNKKIAKENFLTSLEKFKDFDRIFRLRLRQNFWLYLYLTNLSEFQKDFYENYNDILKLNKFRAEKGDISELEYNRLELEMLRIEKQYNDVVLARSKIAKRLSLLIGIEPGNQLLQFRERLAFRSIAELGLKLEKFEINNRPDYKVIESEVKKNRLNIELEKKKSDYFSNLTLGAELRFKTGEKFFGVFAQAPLKIFDRGQGKIYKSKQIYNKSYLKLQSKKKAILLEINTAKKELLSREAILKKYKKIKLLEKNKRVQEKYRTAYLRGASSLVSFLEAEKNYLNVLRSYNEQMYLYYNAIENFLASIGKIGDYNYRR